jgi:hypothetical protein
MTVSLNTPVALSPYSILYTWTSNLSSPTYYIYVDGELASTQTSTSFQVSVVADEPIFVEVFDVEIHTPTPYPASHLTLCWYQVEGITSYRIEEYVNDEWVLSSNFISSGWFNIYRTRYLEDVTLHTFRVIPISDAGEEGEPTVFAKQIVRFPDPPTLAYSYSPGTGTITIEA